MQLKCCFLGLVIFCDKAYNSINPVLTLCFNFLQKANLLKTYFCRYNYGLKIVQFENYQLFMSVEHWFAVDAIKDTDQNSPPTGYGKSDSQ